MLVTSISGHSEKWCKHVFLVCRQILQNKSRQHIESVSRDNIKPFISLSHCIVKSSHSIILPQWWGSEKIEHVQALYFLSQTLWFTADS